MALSTKLWPVLTLRFGVLQNSHKPNEAVLLGLLYRSAALRKFSLCHNPTRNTLSNISLANVWHHELLNPSGSILNKASIWFSIRVLRVKSTRFANVAAKNCEDQIIEPIYRSFQISLSGFLIKQLIGVQYLVHTVSIFAVPGYNMVEYRQSNKRSPLKILLKYVKRTFMQSSANGCIDPSKPPAEADLCAALLFFPFLRKLVPVSPSQFQASASQNGGRDFMTWHYPHTKIRIALMVSEKSKPNILTELYSQGIH